MLQLHFICEIAVSYNFPYHTHTHTLRWIVHNSIDNESIFGFCIVAHIMNLFILLSKSKFMLCIRLVCTLWLSLYELGHWENCHMTFLRCSNAFQMQSMCLSKRIRNYLPIHDRLFICCCDCFIDFRSNFEIPNGKHSHVHCQPNHHSNCELIQIFYSWYDIQHIFFSFFFE